MTNKLPFQKKYTFTNENCLESWKTNKCTKWLTSYGLASQGYVYHRRHNIDNYDKDPEIKHH